MLKNDTDPPTMLLQLPSAQLGQVRIAHDYAALRRPLQQIHAAEQRTFACTGMTDDAEDFTLPNVQVNAANRFCSRRTDTIGLGD